ncbi:helicase-exonuclease AddAB subunit AddB [Paenibacillus abyssi]|uniref:ATP-dependent helicase/deoxyribonuclease subunit B n=1 Tax=Paenibacillus abyssi TaxID=1340531 RepID=A0A917D3W7_9BACL|nr:helicase-exonuclease AddAB subunit AddB [Paenibacillus abyssi]GGG10768.1 ATP-dependent helicase/deoxyribonuclease subunit B [Paenibacillus abyssi]
MALQFVLGRSGTGKTRYCLDRIREQLRQSPDGPPLIMLVPEQATFQTEYALVRTPGLSGTIRAQALSFRRLSFRVMQETGGTALIPIHENGKNMLLYKIVQRIGAELQLFQGATEQQGFIERLGELLTEWKRYGIDALALQDHMSSFMSGDMNTLLDRKLHDLQLIYHEMEKELAGLYIDAEDYLSWLTKGCGEAEVLQGAHIWVDGFYGFTPNEFEALGQLMRRASQVTVTLCLDKPYQEGEQPHELELFHPTAETYIKLRDLALQSGVGLEEPILLEGDPPVRFKNSPMLAHLERHFKHRTAMLVTDRSSFDLEDSRCGVSLHAAAHRRAEVEAVARDMLRRVRSDGLRWRDFAVMVRNGADYNDYITTVFSDHDIPFFLDQKNNVLNHPFIEFIRSALETIVHEWRYEAVFRCIKSEFLLPMDGEVSREALDRLENYVLAAGIDGKRWLDRKRWRPLVQDSLDELPGDLGRADQEAFEAIMDTREAVVGPLRRFQQSIRKAGDVRAMCESLYRLLDHVGAADRLERWSKLAIERGDMRRAREHRQLWDGVMDLLDQLVEMMGDQKVSAMLFSGMLEAGLESLKLAAVPPSLDQVLIGSMDRTRSGTVQVCYVLGANDGVMPMRVQEDGILSEQERDRLAGNGLVMAPGVRRRLLDERFMIYNALTTPRCHLWISYPMSDEEGKSLHPSEVIRHLKLMFPGMPERMITGEPQVNQPALQQMDYIVHPDRTLSYLIAQLRAWRQGQEIADIWWEAFNWFAVRPQWQDKLSLLVSSLQFSNFEAPLSLETARLLYGDHLKASVSRMERFVSCPFQHFAIHGLRLQERKLYRLAAPDIGQLFHAALSKLAGELGESWGTAQETHIRTQAADTVDELAPRLQSQILLSSSRFQYIARKLKEIVAQAAVILGEHARRAEFRPIGLEIGFGPGMQLPSLVLPLDQNRTMEIIGRIDRVDAAETEEGLLLRVLDYKSSSTALRLEEVVNGMSLQMLTYLDVLLTHAPSWLGRPAAAAGVLYFHVHNPLLSASNGLARDEARQLMMKRFKLKGLLLADEHTVRMMDSALDTGYSELLPVALKKDGSFYSSSSVVSREQWDVLRRSVRGTIGRIGKRITEGEVSITPYRMGGKTPCAYCSYKPVCQFDPLFEGNGYVKLSKRSKEEVWQTLAESAELGRQLEEQSKTKRVLIEEEGGEDVGNGA